LAGLPAAPAPAVETSGDAAGNVSPYDVNNVGGAGLMALTSGGDEPKSAKFEAPETPYNGAFARSFNLDVPPFFELTPKLRLGYNSGDNRQHSGDGFSLLGVGWTLSGGGLIERKSSRGGLPKFDATDRFELDGNGLMDCVVEGMTRETPSCSAGGTHTARYETYERIRKIAGDNSWQVTARDGRISTYKPLAFFAPSSSEDARLLSDYRWLLQAVTDTDGNTVTYSYDCAALPTCYVSTISYGISAIQFYWETRTDTFTHATGISLANVTKRLRAVALRNNSTLIRAYSFTYTSSPDTKRSLLASFRQYGSDATVSTAGAISGGTSLPADSFTYWDMSSRRMGTMISDLVTANTAAEGTPSNAATEVEPPAFATGDNTQIGDYDGDGKADQLKKVDGTLAGVGSPTCQLGFVTTSNSQGLMLSPVLPFGCNTPFFAGDFDGDGKSELLSYKNWSSSFPAQPLRGQLQLQGYGTGSTLMMLYDIVGASLVTLSIAPLGPPGTVANAHGQFQVADFTGDGLDDFYHEGVFRSDGTGFAKETWTSQANGRLGDFNADGLADLFVLDGVNGTDTHVLLATGTAFERVSVPGTFTARGDYPWPEFESGTVHGGIGFWTIADFDGDGTTDFTHYRGTSSNTDFNRYNFTGVGFEKIKIATVDHYEGAIDVHGDGRSEGITGSDVQVNVVSTKDNGTYIHLFKLSADQNGDGKPDMSATRKNSAQVDVDSVVPDILKRHTLGSGGTVDVEYLPSTYWTNGYLPFVVQAVSKVTTSDGLGNSSKLKYAYEGGAYDAFERRFLGFAKVTAELPCEAGETTCPWVHAWYRQEAVAAGSLSKLEVYAPNGQVQRRVENGYVVNQASAPFTAFKTSEQVTDFLTGGNAVSRKEWTYDGYANLVEERDVGVVGWSDDDLITSTGYELNLGAYIVDRPAPMTATNSVGTLLRDTQVFYDSASTVGVEPTRGHATTTRKWLGSESRWIAANAEYDSFGQPVAETDPLGHRTERLYDATHQYVVEGRNPLWFDGDTRQKALASWHPLCGAPVTQTDGNGLVTSTQYDALCRQTRVDYPSGEYLTTAFFNIGTPTTQYVESKKSRPMG